MNPKDEELRVKVNWRATAGEPSPLWRKLWARVLINKKGTPANQVPPRDTLTGGAEENDSRE